VGDVILDDGSNKAPLVIIALGLMVDDAVIGVETMVTRLEAGDTRWRAG